jgi:hypothetical protein
MSGPTAKPLYVAKLTPAERATVAATNRISAALRAAFHEAARLERRARSTRLRAN